MTLEADPYRTLGLARGATLDEIKRAYRRLAKANHPDAAGESALPRFLAIQAAYEQLVGGTGATGKGRRSPSLRRAGRGTPIRTGATRPGEPTAVAGGPHRPARDRRAPAPVVGRLEARVGRVGRRARPAARRARAARAARAGPAGRAARPARVAPTTAAPRGPGGRGRRGAPRAAVGRDRRRGRRTAPPAAGPPAAAAGAPTGRGNKATLGSTSYDGVEGPFEPDWGGASWYGTTSGTYWTLNPKEYADPRKHGPEYQARARRTARSRADADAANTAAPRDTDPRTDAPDQPIDARRARRRRLGPGRADPHDDVLVGVDRGSSRRSG